MKKYYIIFFDKLGEWAGNIKDFKTKKEANECAKVNLKLNCECLSSYEIDSYIDNEYYEI